MDDLLAGQLRAGSPAPHRVPFRGQQHKQPGRPLIDPFDVLYEGELPRYASPKDLERIYGSIGFADRVMYSNFVTSLDGVVTLGKIPSAGSTISARNSADRFLMGLLRACADAVLLGAGTLRATPGHLWTAEHIAPDFARSFAELRRHLDRRPRPRLVLVTSSGDIDASHPAIAAGATVATTVEGAVRLRGGLPDTCDVMEVGESGRVDVARVSSELRSRGYQVILTEGGPHLMAELIDKDLLDEAFVTISPVVAGRDGDERLGMLAGVELLPGRGVWSRLLSARRHGDFLFLRYRLR